MLTDLAAIGQDLWRAGIFLDRHIADLFEQGQIDIAFDVTGRAGIAVPVPGAAKVAALFDHANTVDACLAQPCARQQPAKAAANDRHLDLIGQGRAFETGLDIGVIQIVTELGLDLDVLVIALCLDAPIPFRAVLFAQFNRVEIKAHRRSSVGHSGVSLMF